MLLSDRMIRRLAVEWGMITPFVDYKEKDEIEKKGGKINWGVSGSGYDFRLDHAFKRVHRDVHNVDPKEPGQLEDIHHEGRFLLAPGAMILGQTVETFVMPNDIMGLVFTRSTLARVGSFLNVTPIEAGWRGQITLEISNISADRVWIYPGEGIGQIVFMQIAEKPERTYADKKGKYQDQKGVTGPIVRMGVGE